MSYLDHLFLDKAFRKAISGQAPLRLRKQKDLLVFLCGSILSQQLSTRVAATLHRRFLDLFEEAPRADKILMTSPEQLRAIGLSRAKALYIHEVARFSLDQGLEIETLAKWEDDRIIEYLTQIKGVGRWTAEMVLMFALGRPDIFASGDLGIQQAMKGIYTLDDRDKKKFLQEMEKIAHRWRPYRTYACMHLWKHKDQT